MMLDSLQKIEDRWLIMLVLIVFAVCFTVTRDAVLADITKILIGAFCTVILKRTDRQLIVTGTDMPTAKAIAADFASKQ